MFLRQNVFIILVIQICYCSACQCSYRICIPTPAVYVIGITIPLMLLTITVLSVMVYRLKRGQGSEDSVFGNRHVSISKFKRQMSGNSQCPLECAQFENENNAFESHASMNTTNDFAKEPNGYLLQKVLKNPQGPILEMDQMRKICEGVILKSRMKETTSLTDLDKIVNDAKMECTKHANHPNIVESTPKLDVYDMLPSPIPLTNANLVETNSNSPEDEKRESSNDSSQIKAISDELVLKFNTVNSNVIDNLDEMHEIAFNQDSETVQNEVKTAVKSDFVQKDAMPKFSQNEQLAAVYNDLKKKFNQGTDKSKINISETQSKIDHQSQSNDEGSVEKKRVERPLSKSSQIVVQEDIYDSPPCRTSAQETIGNELYDTPPSRSFLAKGKPEDDLYVSPISECRKIIVTDDVAGYDFPVSDSDVTFFTEPHYSNAKTVSDFDCL